MSGTAVTAATHAAASWGRHLSVVSCELVVTPLKQTYSVYCLQGGRLLPMHAVASGCHICWLQPAGMARVLCNAADHSTPPRKVVLWCTLVTRHADAAAVVVVVLLLVP